MYFVKLEAVPAPNGPNFVEFGGAQVVAWVRTDSEEAAHSYLRRHLAEEGWLVAAIEQSRLCNRSEFEGNETATESFSEAEEEGGSIWIHTWPNAAQDEDPIH